MKVNTLSYYIKWGSLCLFLGFAFQCKEKNETQPLLPKGNPVQRQVIKEQPKGMATPEGMVWIPGGSFVQGADEQDTLAMHHEKPAHTVWLDGFFMDITEVTNAEFSAFVKATKYVTLAERPVDWELLKQQLPAGTPRPHDSIMQAGSLTFSKAKKSLPNLYDFSQWWRWTIGANWKHPHGPDSTIVGKEDHPVVHIAYEDALAYCQWAGKQLPTEAQWEFAARGTQKESIFSWGNASTQLSERANTWEGEFPVNNTTEDGYKRTAPVKSYPSNSMGLYDMAGNVWEWTSDWYHIGYYKTLKEKGSTFNPRGADKGFNPDNPRASEKVIKGGSFLCSDSYCASYRLAARMGSSIDSSLEHLGFRTVLTPKNRGGTVE